VTNVQLLDASPFTPTTIPHLAEARRYSCSGTNQYRQVTANIVFPKTSCDSIIFHRNNSVGRLLLLNISKTSLSFVISLSEMIIPEILWVRANNSE
jgi:hypothetical protein